MLRSIDADLALPIRHVRVNPQPESGLRKIIRKVSPVLMDR